MSAANLLVRNFLKEHPEELVDGKLKVCVAGGSGFIGSHIAKVLKVEAMALRQNAAGTFSRPPFQVPRGP